MNVYLAGLCTDAAALYRGAADLVYRTDTGHGPDAEAQELAGLVRPRLPAAPTARPAG